VSPREAPRHLVVGQVKKAHGLRGEVSVRPLTDHPESTFAPGVVLLLGDEKGRLQEGEPTVRVETVRPFRRGVLVRFEGTTTRNHSEQLRGLYLLKPASELEGREEDELFYHELLNLHVVTTDGLELGQIREVYELRPAHMLEVRGPGKAYMIPFLKEIIVGVDLDVGVLTIDPPPGLLDI
jgi:16S rRNA processing protein RimM